VIYAFFDNDHVGELKPESKFSSTRMYAYNEWPMETINRRDMNILVSNFIITPFLTL